MQEQGAANIHNDRRKAAVRLALDKNVEKVAELVRCSSRSIRNWLEKWRRGGEAALNERSWRSKGIRYLEKEKVDQMLVIRIGQAYGCSKISFDVRCSSSIAHKHMAINKLSRLSP